MSQVTIIAVSQPFYERFLSNIHRNDGNVRGNKTAILADLEYAGSGCNMQIFLDSHGHRHGVALVPDPSKI